MKITDLDEGIFDLFSRGSQASGLNNIGNMAGKTQADMPTVTRKAKELLDNRMPEQQVVQALQQEFGVNPRIAQQAIRMAQSGVGMEESDNFGMSTQQRKLANLGRVLMDQATTTKNDELSNVMAKVGNELTNFGANFGPKNLKDLVKKTDVPASVIQKLLAYADKILTAQSNLQKDHKDGGLNDSMNENNAAQAAAMLSKIDMVLDGSGLKRQGFELVKDPNSFTRGSITREAEANIRRMLAKAKAMGATDGPALDPNPTVNPADIDDSEFTNVQETTSAGSVASVATPVGGLIARQPRNPDGTAKNGLDSDNVLSNGKPKKKKSSRSN